MPASHTPAEVIAEIAKFINDFSSDTYPNTPAGEYSYMERGREALQRIKDEIEENSEGLDPEPPEINAIPGVVQVYHPH